jgi:hypothetical protein
MKLSRTIAWPSVPSDDRADGNAVFAAPMKVRLEPRTWRNCGMRVQLSKLVPECLLSEPKTPRLPGNIMQPKAERGCVRYRKYKRLIGSPLQYRCF